MRAVLFDRAAPGEAPRLRVGEVPEPEPDAGEVRIKVAAHGLNHADLMRMSGRRIVGQEQWRLGHEGLGFEASGVVDAVGRDVQGISVGDRVSTVPNADGPYHSAAEYALADQRFVTPWPTGWSSGQAAGFWMAYLSAYYPMVELSPVGEGSAVLVTAASGGAGLGAVHLARSRGARVLATTRHAGKRSFLRENGVDRVIDSEAEDVAAVMLEATGGRGVDLVSDGIGGSFASRYVGGLADGGIAYVYGALSGEADLFIPLLSLIMRRAGVHGYSLGNVTRDPEALRRGTDHVQEGIRSGRLPRPAIDSTYAFDEVEQAYARMRSGEQRGKIVVSIDGTLD